MDEITETSKFLSYVLRHHPEAIGLELDPAGWVSIGELVDAARRSGRELDHERIERVLTHNDKDRFSVSDDGERIRASYGHSIEVDLGWTPTEPPDALCHGTARRFLDSIRQEGLRPKGRQWVHLNSDDADGRARAQEVGGRHGSPVVLRVSTSRMEGPFYRSEGGIWLVDGVPPTAIERASDGSEL